jgi:hypothetical protein
LSGQDYRKGLDEEEFTKKVQGIFFLASPTKNKCVVTQHFAGMVAINQAVQLWRFADGDVWQFVYHSDFKLLRSIGE